MGFCENELTTIIVTHNSALVLSECLDSLARCFAGNVMVVDNGSDDDSADLARAAGVEVHQLGRNTGFSRAANYGAGKAHSPFLCFLNPDCIVEGELLERAAQVLRSGRRCVALPDFLHDDGSIIPGRQPGYTRKKMLADIIENNRGWSRVVRLIKRLPGYDARHWHWPLCACVFTPRDLFFEAGGFDERYFLYMEDVEFGLSLARAGAGIASLDFTLRHRAQLGAQVSFAYRMKLLNTARLQYASRHYGKGYEKMLRMLIPVEMRIASEGD